MQDLDRSVEGQSVIDENRFFSSFIFVTNGLPTADTGLIFCVTALCISTYRSNCDPAIMNKLRKHYTLPYFIPEDSESSQLDWIFMGGAGIKGADMHVSERFY